MCLRYERVGYNASASSTAVTLDSYGSIEYFGGVTSGPATSDLFTLISEDSSPLSWNQTFLAANESSWTAMPADGFLGLAFSTIAAPDTTTLVETLMQQELIDEPRFGIYYGKEFSTTGNNPEGVLTLGGSKEDTYVEGDLTFVPLRKEAEFQVWRVSLKSITGIKSITSDSPTTATQTFDDGRAVFDTGAGDIEVPTEQIYGLYESIGFNYTALLYGDYIPMCTEFNSSWSVTFTFDGSTSTDSPTITLTGDQLINPGFADNELACFPPFSETTIPGFVLIGTPLLHRFYTVWDFGDSVVDEYKPRIGFGKLKDECKP